MPPDEPPDDAHDEEVCLTMLHGEPPDPKDEG
jgi:hypothetical protein